MKRGIIEVVYVGEKFYHESLSGMSSWYRRMDDGTLERYTLGEIEADVAVGYIVTLRPATKFELQWAETVLEAYKR